MPPTRAQNSKASTSKTSLRELTILGERAMSRAEAEGRTLLDDYPSDVVRSYAASGLMMVALEELRSGVPRAVAVETLKDALNALDGMPS